VARAHQIALLLQRFYGNGGCAGRHLQRGGNIRHAAQRAAAGHGVQHMQLCYRKIAAALP